VSCLASAHRTGARLPLRDHLDLSPKLRQTVKTGISANGEFYLCRCCLEGNSRKKRSWLRFSSWKQARRLRRWRGPLEVNPNLLHRWRKEFRHGPRNAFPGVGERRWMKRRSPSSSARLDSRRLRSSVLAKNDPALLSGIDPGRAEWEAALTEWGSGQYIRVWPVTGRADNVWR
jgi:hypothetical protein